MPDIIKLARNEWMLFTSFKDALVELTKTLKETNKILEKPNYQDIYNLRNELKKYVEELTQK